MADPAVTGRLRSAFGAVPVWGRYAAFGLVLAASLMALGAGVASRSEDAPPRSSAVGLFTSLPLVWGESPSLAGLLDAERVPHWSRTVLERHGPLRPLDSLAPDGGALPLSLDALLVVAQPRALAPLENVALDEWVRAGGRALLFVDPMLTQASLYPIGDPRRPQDTALLSPILSHWGLELRFDAAQSGGERLVAVRGQMMPVNRSGTFVRISRESPCRIEAQGLLARCRIGRGVVLALADAALLESAGRLPARRRMLDRLLTDLAR